MKLAGGPENYFKVLEQEGVTKPKPFREIGAMGITLPGVVPIAVGVAVAKPLDKKVVKQIVQEELDKERKSHCGPGLNGISFF